ncbi:50S ribosomal protein L10 [Marinisporobacter balticus]|uniref:Large ribosomal subunit protein uL10 n=1 Tax=Marinisporobacter balticus TaxID=2018667 RepID=A0A4R2L742_9FIRM|nr:50S ribosomal protein L10 [Marinisporobacter balticus]TCO75025.1 LSU ribosomal protein L10P [Marinisporobacter balticus]
MSSNLELKKQVVEEIKEKFTKAQSAVVVDYRGLTVEEATALRKNMREAGVDYKVYKNTLTRLAVKGTEFEPLTENLTGPNAVAFGYEDPITPAKILNDFAKEHKALELKSCVVEGQYYGVDTIKQIAEIPSREVLLAKFLGSIKSPISNFAYLLQAIADKNEGSAEA